MAYTLIFGTIVLFSFYGFASAPILPDAVWDYLYSFRVITLVVIGLVTLSVLFYFFALDLQRHFLAVYFAGLSAISNFIQIIAYTINKHKEGSVFCADNATPYAAHIPGGAFCTFQSLASTYLLIALCCCSDGDGDVPESIKALLREKRTLQVQF